MSHAHPDDIERLASRLAMIVSDDGEAGNAGVAAAHLARRMGLTGGQLKAIVLSGAAQEGTAGPHAADLRAAADQATRADRLAGETAGLRHSLHQLDIEVRRAHEEADHLRDVSAALIERLDRSRAVVRNQRRVAAVVVLLAAVAGAGVAVLPMLRPGPLGATSAALSVGAGQVAICRVPGAEVRREPDRASDLIARLALGGRVPVRRLVWRNLGQWAEITTDGQVGFVSTNDVEMP